MVFLIEFVLQQQILCHNSHYFQLAAEHSKVEICLRHNSSVDSARVCGSIKVFLLIKQSLTDLRKYELYVADFLYNISGQTKVNASQYEYTGYT